LLGELALLALDILANELCLHLSLHLAKKEHVILIHRIEVRRQFRKRAVRNGALPSVVTCDHTMVAIKAILLDEALVDLLCHSHKGDRTKFPYAFVHLMPCRKEHS